jgi:hypothetical protein
MLPGITERLKTIKEPSPLHLAGLEFNRFFFIAVFVPCIFLLIKLANLEILSSSAAGSIASFLGFFWPVLPSQYAALMSFSTVQDASNYVLFFLCLFLLGAAFFPIFVRDCIENRSMVRIENIRWKEVFVILLLVFSSYSASVLDTPPEQAKPIRNSYVDKFGFYYLRQFALFVTVYLTVLIVSAFAILFVVRDER